MTYRLTLFYRISLIWWNEIFSFYHLGDWWKELCWLFWIFQNSDFKCTFKCLMRNLLNYTKFARWFLLCPAFTRTMLLYFTRTILLLQGKNGSTVSLIELKKVVDCLSRSICLEKRVLCFLSGIKLKVSIIKCGFLFKSSAYSPGACLLLFSIFWCAGLS